MSIVELDERAVHAPRAHEHAAALTESLRQPRPHAPDQIEIFRARALHRIAGRGTRGCSLHRAVLLLLRRH